MVPPSSWKSSTPIPWIESNKEDMMNAPKTTILILAMCLAAKGAYQRYDALSHD